MKTHLCTKKHFLLMKKKTVFRLAMINTHMISLTATTANAACKIPLNIKLNEFIFLIICFDQMKKKTKRK